MAEERIYPFSFKPGVKRDNTLFEGEYYTDGLWCRWDRGKPRKIGGYLRAYNQFSGIVRGETQKFPINGYNWIYGGSEGALETVLLSPNGTGGTYYNVTPAGFVTNPQHEWSMTSIYDSSGSTTMIVAVAKLTLNDVADATENQIYYGNIIAGTALAALGSNTTSGGVVALPPYLFIYGHDGYVAWSDKNAIANIGAGAGGDAGEARICSSKVVKGMPLRGGATNAPAGLFWSLDTLQRISYVGGDSVFRNDTLATEISILSSNATIDYDGIFFWPGVDRFLSYNGVVQEVPNEMNRDFFFNNYNKLYAQKIFAFKVPRYGEIWYCFPYGQSTEANWAIIQNVREKTWYDTPLPEGGRSAGMSSSSTFPYPLLFGVEPDDVNKYSLWMHEYGVDKLSGGQPLAIDSYYETANIAWMGEGPMNASWVGRDRWVRVIRIEPDYVLTGSLQFTLKGRDFADSPDLASKTYYYDGSTTFKIDSRKQYRQLRIQVRSNEAGGDYFQGTPCYTLGEGDKRASAGASI